MARAPRTVEFDHLPSDDEAAVYFAPRNGAAGYRILDRDGVLRIESRDFPTLTICVLLIVFVAAIVGFGDRFPNPMSDQERAFFGFLGAMNGLVFYALFSWLNRSARALNPLVAFDRPRFEVRLAERERSISAGDVVAIIDWRLTDENARELGFHRQFFGEGDNGPPRRHVMLLAKDGPRYRLEYLFHDPIELCRRGNDPTLVLAEALDRPVRKIRNSSSVRDLRPIDPFTKRF